MASHLRIYPAVAALLLVALAAVATSSDPSPAKASVASSLQPYRVEQTLREQVTGVVEEWASAWPQVLEQTWPDSAVGPDNYKYIFLGMKDDATGPWQLAAFGRM